MDHLTNTAPQQPIDHQVLVVGEALIDVVASAEGSISHPGGSPANVAFGLGRLGAEVGLLTALGDDDFGDRIQEHLRTAQVRLLPGCVSLPRTASATAVLGDDGSARYEFDINWDLAPRTLEPLPKILHAGSIATFLEPGAAAVAALLEQAKGRCLVTYDPNIRPALLGAHDQAQATFERMAQLCDLVKLSDEDAAWLYPDLDAAQAVGRILELGVSLVVLTRGAAGSTFSTAEDQVEIPAVPSQVADTIGAGDAFMSALLYGLLHQGNLRLDPLALAELGRTSAAAAALAVRRPGAMPPTIDELAVLLDEESSSPVRG
ncbi:carbohydrate kinase [Glutamicibacter arilaitensis]|uniref:carbohydrate kinase family protein n=1 Tax=Glutamicibacter arilaitensis TaxID=256701 RepID=UPI00384F9871